MLQMSSTVIQIATQTLGEDMIVFCSFLYAFGTIYKTYQIQTHLIQQN